MLTIIDSILNMFNPCELEALGGICIVKGSHTDASGAERYIKDWCAEHGLSAMVEISKHPFLGKYAVNVHASPLLRELTPNFDTSQLANQLALQTKESVEDLYREIFLCMAASPVAYSFPTRAELFASIRARSHVVQTARRTELNFEVTQLSRPLSFWDENDEGAFVLRPGESLIEALEAALCPDISGRRYSFSCREASEYLMLFGLAKELQTINPHLLEELATTWRCAPLIADEFNEAFLFERGSRDRPFPKYCYVPGGRVWFKNPDEHSVQADGFEGSWVCYLGCGEFVNLWDKAKPYSIEKKCVEIYHWRHGVYTLDSGTVAMNEDLVGEKMIATLSDKEETRRILAQMMEYRAPPGVYGTGGCIDMSRDSLKWVCEGTSNIRL
jgi:hypothetical protein